MAASNLSQDIEGNDSKSPSQRTEEDDVEELILDYACKNYMQRVISEILRDRDENWYHTLHNIPHLRFIASTLYSIIHEEVVKDYEEALRQLYVIHGAKADLISAKQFVKLTAGLKAKIILGKLETQFDYAVVCAKLNQFFPKAELHAKGVTHEQARLNNYQLSLRRKLTRLIVSPSVRQAYQDSVESHELGDVLTASLQDLVKVYTGRLNENLTVPVIEQIASEGPHSQISRDVQDSPLSCMDHLLSICFKGPPSEDQLLHLVTLTKEARSKAAATTDDVGLLSSSSSDEAGQRRSTRIRTAKQGVSQTGSALLQGTSHHGLQGSNSRNETSRTTGGKSAHKGNTSPITRKQGMPSTSDGTSAVITSKPASDIEKKLCEEVSTEHEVVQTPERTLRHLPPKSKIYFSTSMNRSSRSSQPTQTSIVNRTDDGSSQAKSAEPATGCIDKTGPTSVPCGTPDAGHESTDQTKVNNTKGIFGSESGNSQRNSESSGSSSSQSVTSVSLLPASRGKVIQISHKAKRSDVLVEEDEESQQQHVEYTGSITVIEETPLSGEINNEDAPIDQCNTVTSSGSTTSGPSQTSQTKEQLDEGDSDDLQDSNVSSVFDSLSIVDPSPEALESSSKYTFIRTPLVTSQGG
ncbi:uncharacterized protein [Amphiura filiformis]|uniref:uncharacterized protein n=1 Tax=Amphiura filiformis TaxID=82378 RepID=UPI003B223803